MTVQIMGLNLEKLLCEAQASGIRLYAVRRNEARCVSVRVSSIDYRKIAALCEQFGWTAEEIEADCFLRLARLLRARAMLFAGAALCLLLIALSSRMVLQVSVVGSAPYDGQVRAILSQEGVRPGCFQRSISFDALRQKLLHRLPALKQVELRFAGSTLIAQCHLVREGELVEKTGTGNDLIAAQSGVVTGIAVSRGTPVVCIGEAVRAGQILIRGEEAAAQGTRSIVSAQGQVTARVWARGKAKMSLYFETAKETGRTRTRVTILTPWTKHVMRQAEPFEQQNEIISTQRIIDLFIPLLRRTQIFEEIIIERKARTQTDAKSLAQGAAENLAKKQLPAGVLILDKWVDYSMIDNEFVCADVVLEYEQDIAVRPEDANLSP